MSIIRLVGLVGIIVTAYAISIPVNSITERCMVVFSQAEEDYLKLDMKFERFNGQSKEEGYRITLLNTETNDK